MVQRNDKVKGFGVCSNCMRAPARMSCTRPMTPSGELLFDGGALSGADRHHMLLHGGGQAPANPTEVSGTGSSTSKEVQGTNALSSSVRAHTGKAENSVLLATARVLLRNAAGNVIKVRALLDSGSEAILVSEWVSQTLRLQQDPVDVIVTGLQRTQTGTVTSSVRTIIGSEFLPALRLETDALVLRSLTNLLPSRRVLRKTWPHLRDLTLADPEFNLPARVDVIL